MSSSPSPVILIVDDFEDALEIYRDYLTFKGWRVVTAASGPEAITVALMERPDLIFMDLRMAHMTGTDAMRALRANPDFQTVPIIAFTAHALDEERRIALQDGFDEVIPKPCLPDEFLAAVTRLLASKSLPSSVSSSAPSPSFSLATSGPLA